MRALRAALPTSPPPWDTLIDLDNAIEFAEALEIKDKIGLTDILLGPFHFGLKAAGVRFCHEHQNDLLRTGKCVPECAQDGPQCSYRAVSRCWLTCVFLWKLTRTLTIIPFFLKTRGRHAKRPSSKSS